MDESYGGIKLESNKQTREQSYGEAKSESNEETREGSYRERKLERTKKLENKVTEKQIRNRETREESYGGTKLESNKQESWEENHGETREDIDMKRIAKSRNE